MGIHLDGLYEKIFIIFLVGHLCSTLSAFRLKRLRCFKDLCERGVQYCVPERERCFNCKDVVHNCGTDSMPLQCDAFCREVEAISRERTLNRTFENYNKVNFIGTKYTNHTNGEIDSQGYEIATYILIGFLVLSLTIISGLIVSRKRTRKAFINKGKDVEETPLMPETDIQHHNKQLQDQDNRDHNRDSVKADAEMELQKDVSPEDEIKRDSKVSEDSAVGSLKSGDEVKLEGVGHRNDESVPKTEVAQGQNKHWGPTQENPAPGGEELYNNGVQNTRAMNPTKGENAKTFELAINNNPSPLLKTSDILAAQPVS